MVSPARADISGGLDWSAWQRMPVLQDGRIMPLDSFSRAQVSKICGDSSPMLGRLGTLTPKEVQSMPVAELQQWVAESQPRRFLAAELLFSWYVEPQLWEDRPFLIAANEDLRTLLGVPLLGEDGSRLRHVSPRQVRNAGQPFKDLLEKVASIELEADRKGQNPQFSPLQESARRLWMAFMAFQQLSFDPARDDVRDWSDDVADLCGNWQRFHERLQGLSADGQPEIVRLDGQINQAMLKLADAYRPMQAKPPSPQDMDALIGQLRQSTADMARQTERLAKRVESQFASEQSSDARQRIGVFQSLARWAENISLQAAVARWSLYDAHGEALFVVPSLETTALEADRHRSDIHPWISLQALLEGSPDLLHGYTREHVEQVRSSWAATRDAYLNRREQFDDGMRKFTVRVRALATEIEPSRQELPIIERDKGLLAKTAYPRTLVTDAEMLYNQVDPFRWAWIASLVAASFLGLSFLFFRKPLFWLGTGTLAASVALLASGFAVRVYITHWAPVTSMFETMVWVSMCVALLTLWGTFLPLLTPASKKAWAWTAIPGSWEDKATDAPTLPRAVALTLRLVLFLAGLYIIGVIPAVGDFFRHADPSDSYGGQEYSLVSLLPRADVGSNLPSVSSTLVWLSSIFVAGVLTWYLPRLIPAALIAIGMSIASARRADSAEAVEKIYSWRAVALVGALASFTAALLANYASFPRDIQALMPVLRSNFWLGIHVLTITTSYAGAAAAWVIGNLAIGFYAFGRYRTAQPRHRANAIAVPEVIDRDFAGESSESFAAVEIVQGERRPPDFCGTLAKLNYLVVQITVLLLAAGTILGGLWADVSWGRFWGWDPKEVGALIALLILLAALHGRRAGWPGDLTLAIGSIMGFFGVLWAWYVVNFLLNAGMHSYGAGEGGGWVWLVAVVGIQLLFIATAVTRVRVETAPASCK